MSQFLEKINFADRTPELSHRFGVFFFAGGLIPNPIDIRFQKVSGMSTEVQLETINEGGQNLHTHRLPSKVSYTNLVLERGYVTSRIPSPLNLEFNLAFSRFKFYPSNVLVTKFNEAGNPIGAWLFLKAYPVKWSVSDLDAQSNSVAIDTMELAYTRFQIMRI
ncbi:phage tail protein [Aquimarina sp. AD10]|uniref:Phage tail protein n=1 Tax=Aquimarina aggregata TaxID=1642818 RepID=A0A163AZU6_9FLAO|nr:MULTISPECIES: phage tail protein [Aquimarina]AXT61401.1 phage tail protein [Aquimarina sp. AD10]KZS40932.1 phage tail protein [Aquimarina aggregata]RKN01405.1 phage tail protein [Aquimarina sp. AD10]